MTVENVVHESKWGFHSVSKEAYSKLRFLNAIYDKSLHLAAAWERWNNKLPQNRIQKRAIRDDKGWKIGSEIVLDLNGNPISLIEPKLCPLFHNFAKSKWSDEFYVQDNGFGEMILRRIMAEAASRNQPVTIHVERFNRALGLYQRLGFQMLDDSHPVYLLMEWRPIFT